MLYSTINLKGTETLVVAKPILINGVELQRGEYLAAGSPARANLRRLSTLVRQRYFAIVDSAPPKPKETIVAVAPAPATSEKTATVAPVPAPVRASKTVAPPQKQQQKQQRRK